MKIRNGYVSNSSSSSFLVVGVKKRFDEINIKDMNIYVRGKQLNDGEDFFQLDKSKYQYIRDNIKDKKIFEFYDVDYFESCEEQLADIEYRQCQQLFEIEQDYHYSIDVQDIEHRYFEQTEEKWNNYIYFLGKQISKHQFELLFDKVRFAEVFDVYQSIFVFYQKEPTDAFYTLKRVRNLRQVYQVMQISEDIDIRYYLVKFQDLKRNLIRSTDKLKGLKIYSEYCKEA